MKFRVEFVTETLQIPGSKSKRLSPEEVIAGGPYDLIVVCPCGMTMEETRRETDVSSSTIVTTTTILDLFREISLDFVTKV